MRRRATRTRLFCQIRTGGVTTILGNAITPDSNGDWSYTTSLSSNEAHTFTASATDFAGNIGTGNKLLLGNSGFNFLSDKSPGDVFVGNGWYDVLQGGGGH